MPPSPPRHPRERRRGRGPVGGTREPPGRWSGFFPCCCRRCCTCLHRWSARLLHCCRSPAYRAEPAADPRQQELELVRQHYLGIKKEKKRVAHPSERNKFVFDWKTEEDTSRDLNPLYARPAEVSFLFGRGMLAGVDRKEQIKVNLEHERILLEKSREAMADAGDEAVAAQPLQLAARCVPLLPRLAPPPWSPLPSHPWVQD